ncbi:MAG TPA: iron ABC transporter permease [Chloroflexota bacterium]|nr:iron ABC transporter permease [Chloroflexota bacterium]
MATLTLPRQRVRERLKLPTLRADQVVFALITLIVLGIVVPPVVTLLRTSVLVGAGPGRAGTLSLESYSAIVRAPEFAGLMGNTFLFALGSCFVGLLLGGCMAWFTERTNAPFKQLVYAASFVSFAVPGILRTVGWIFLLGPRTGTLNELFRSVFHSDRVLLDVFTMPAMIAIEGTFWIPVVFLMLSASFRSMDPSLEEAAIMSGSSTVQTVRRVTLRLVLPAMLSALLLMFIRGIQAFEVPLVLGVPSKIYVLTTEVFISMQARVIPEYSRPAAYGVLLFAFLLACIYAYSRVTRRTSRFVTVTGKGFRPRQLDLGRGRIIAGAFILLVVIIQFLPVIELVAASFLRSLGSMQLTTGNYTLVLGSPAIMQSLINSLLIASVSATAVVIIAAVVAWCMVRGQTPMRGLLDQLTSLPLVFSGVVLGLAVLILYVRSPVPVYGTIWILVIAYVTAFLPYGLRYAHPGLLQIAPELEESGQMSGARWAQVFRKIVIPLLIPALFAAWVFVFLISLRELSAAALLYTAQSPVIATKMLDLWTNGNVNQVSAFGAIVSALSITLAIAAYRVVRRQGLRAS